MPHEDTDQFCEGPCVTETHLVLNCIGSVMSHFEFYNKATIQDVSETIKDGCGFGNQRGKFRYHSFVFFPLVCSFTYVCTKTVVFFFSLFFLGNFNVAEHVQEENSGGDKITMRMVAAGFVLMILVQGLLF